MKTVKNEVAIGEQPVISVLIQSYANK